ncbi:hypothetical protein F2Q70_00012342 [Brassica cretica]|uniref:Uncharacterized protein n=1 Tax=Brassica cretica TaxID=69181 RepID=A0A8S9MCD7_BRACR|nr:hypothetical protein F2Q70_00012342 [Brassica cretica]
MEQTTYSYIKEAFQNSNRRLQKRSMTQLVAWTKASNRGLAIQLNHRSTLTSQHRSIEGQNELAIYWVPGDSTGKRRISMEYTEMIRDTPEILMDTPFLFTTEISEEYWKELQEMSQATYDEINEMFYGVCGEHEKNKEAFQMKLDGVYYPLNDSISWLTTCMEEMKQDIARFQSASDVARPTSIDNHLHTSIDSGLRTSIDNRISASVDANPPHSHSIKSQSDFHTRAEIDQIVEGIYRALESTEERLDGRCDDIYFPMDLSISALTSKIEAIQRELVEIQSYIARRREASPSIDRRNNKSTNIHQQISVDKASNRGRLAQKITSNMSDTHNHEEDISADTYARLIRHQFNLESLGDRLQKIKDATTIMEDKWRRGDEAMRDFTNSTKDTKVDQPVNYVTLGEIV